MQPLVIFRTKKVTQYFLHLFCIGILSFSNEVLSQTLSLEGFCITDSAEVPTLAPDELYRGGASMGECYPDYPGPFYLRVYAHAVRKDGCVEGQTKEKITEAMTRLINNFRVHNIFLIWDNCEIQEHCYTATYNLGAVGLVITCLPPNPPCLRQFIHSDGIDIFFGGDNVYTVGIGGFSMGNVPTTNGRAIIVAGEFPGDPFPKIIDTDVLTHEMGHALGLLHTFQTWGEESECDPCQELVDMSNCEMCGDLVCDTPADPYGATLQTAGPQDECEYDTGDDADCNEDPFDPDETNYMSNAHASCLSTFSPCQVERMRYMIATSGSGGPNLGLLNDRRFSYDEINPDITTSTIWDNTTVGSLVTIQGNLTIAGGKTLTIGENTTIRFSEGAKLIIEPNATLELYGTLSGLCDKTWQGVEVQGSTSTHSQYAVGGVRYQGLIVFHSGSMIENAVIGVQLWGPTRDLAGGQLKGGMGTIQNCHIGIDYAPYNNFWPFSSPSGQQNQPRNYLGSITQFTFINDNDYRIVDLPFNAFVNMVGVDGIKVSGSSFTNTQDVTGNKIADWGYGIHASDAGFSVEPRCIDTSPIEPCTHFAYSNFYGLGYGVYAARQIQNRPFKVSGANFEHCFTGVNNLLVLGSTLVLNHFQLGTSPSLNYTELQIGIAFIGSGPFTCEENEFENSEEEEVFAVGILANGTGTANKTIRRNDFHDMNVGSIANYINADNSSFFSRGLYFDCNRNYSSLELDISVSRGPIKSKQGLEIVDPLNPGTIVYLPAGNRFTNVTEDFNNSSIALEYFYKSSGTNENPISTGSITETPSAYTNSCAVSYCAPPCLTEPDITVMKSDFGSILTSFNTVKSSYLITPTAAKKNSMSYYQKIMDYNSYMIALHEMYDTTTFHVDTLFKWVGKMNSKESDFLLAGEWLRRGNLSTALATLDSIVSRNQLVDAEAEDIDFCKDITTLLDGADIYNLHPDTIDLLNGFSDVGGIAEYWAQSILFANGFHYEPKYYMDEGYLPFAAFPESGGIILEGNHLISQQSVANKFMSEDVGSILNVFPNPGSDVVNFEFINAAFSNNISLEIFDMNGIRLDYIRSFNLGNTYTWNATSYPGGCYYYRVGFEGTSLQGRFILIK